MALGLVVSVGLHASAVVWAKDPKVTVRELRSPLLLELFDPPKARVAPRQLESPKQKAVRTPAKPPPVQPPGPADEVKPPALEATPLFVGGMRMLAGTDGGTAPSLSSRPGLPGPPGPADRAAQVESEFKIPYPDEARRAGVEGTVRLRIEIDAEGRVTDAKVLSGPGHGLNEAARGAIQKFKFTPQVRSGVSGSTTMRYDYTFRLD